MRPFYRKLTFKIGSTIILTELLVLIAVGFGIVRLTSRHIEEDLTNQVLIPTAIITSHRQNLDLIEDKEALEQIMGIPVIDAMLVSPSNKAIMNASDPTYVGEAVAEIADGAFKPDWFEPDADRVLFWWGDGGDDILVCVAPVRTTDDENLLFYVVVRVKTTHAIAQKNHIIQAFILSALIITGLTSLIITLSFNRLILNRLTAILDVMHSAESGKLYTRITEPILDDEVGDLQLSVNSLISQLAQYVTDLIDRITEQRLTEAALRQSEVKFRDVVEGTADLITQVDKSGQFIYVNHTAEHIFGLSQEELIGLSAFDFIHPDDREQTEMAFLEWIKGRTTGSTFENRQISHNGHVFHMMWTVNVHFDEYGNVNYVNSIGRDITQRKQVEEQLQLQSTALAATANGIVITGPKGKVRWVNPAFTRLTGFTLDEIFGQDLSVLNSGQQGESFYDEMWQMILSGQVWQGELINRHKDGRLYSEEMTITPVINAAGEIINFVSVKQDISERKKAEADLRARATSLELIAQVGRRTTAILELDELLHQAAQLIGDSFNYYNVVIRLIEDDYLVLKATSLASLQPLAGRATLKIGQGITGWVAQHGEPLLVPDVSQDPRYHAELSAMQTVSEVAVPIKLKGIIIGVLDTQSIHADEFDEDDVFTLQAIAAQLAVAIENARLYNAAQQEISDRRHAEKQLKIYTAELEHNNRELQNFAYVSSHDLQEPLRKIQLFGDRLADKYGETLDDRGRDYLRRMQDAAARMQSLIIDLLAFSRAMTRTDPFVMVDLHQVTHQVLEDLEVQLETSHGRIQLDALPTLQADATQMHQLLQNLISNALKYHKSDEPPLIRIWGELMPYGMVQINVQDNGIGFEEKYLDRIFTLFQRLHGRSEYEGTGIGLAICRRIVERHSGSITARSTPGTGSTFIVTLPQRQQTND